ncbi:MAG TPA: PDZ domain-containing protein [Caulifigura sp.]|nr:PDZ domain-containing protein [Caulifigura sp.]
MLSRRYWLLALPLAMQFSAVSAATVRAEEDEEQRVIIVEGVKIAEGQAAEEQKARSEAIKEKAEELKAKAKELQQAARERAEKARAKATAEAKADKPLAITIVGTKVEEANAAEPGKDGTAKVTVRGQFKVTSPDGKTFEIVAPEGMKTIHDKIVEVHGQKLPAEARVFTLIRSSDGVEKKIELDDAQKLITELTARVKDSGGETPKFVIGVSVSEAPPVVLTQIGKPDAAAVVVDTVVEESPAQKAGVMKFDLILKAAGEPVKSAGDLTKAVKSSDGKEIELVLVRTGKEVKVTVAPKPTDPEAMKAKIADGMIQFGPAMMMNRQFIGPGQMPGMAPGNLLEEIKAVRKDIEELKKMVEELKK